MRYVIYFKHPVYKKGDIFKEGINHRSILFKSKNVPFLIEFDLSSKLLN